VIVSIEDLLYSPLSSKKIRLVYAENQGHGETLRFAGSLEFSRDGTVSISAEHMEDIAGKKVGEIDADQGLSMRRRQGRKGAPVFFIIVEVERSVHRKNQESRQSKLV